MVRTDNPQKLIGLLEDLIHEMKAENWRFTDHMYDQAKIVLLDELGDRMEEDELRISKMMLGAMFLMTLQGMWEDEADMVCARDDQFMYLHGDVSRYFVMRAPANDHGYSSVLCGPDNTILAALNDDGTKSFHTYQARMAKKVEHREGE